MKHALLLILGLALALPLQAGGKHSGSTQKAGHNPARVFKKRDKDHDGFLTKDEFLSGRKKAGKAEKAFSRKDKDSDGKLSRAEFTGKTKAAKKGGAKGKKKAGRKHP